MHPAALQSIRLGAAGRPSPASVADGQTRKPQGLKTPGVKDPAGRRMFEEDSES